jgi:hypothetical protein
MEAAQSTIAAQKRQYGARIHEKLFPLGVSAGFTADYGLEGLYGTGRVAGQ